MFSANNKLITSSLKHNASQLKELNKRRKAHLSGKAKSYTFEEVKEYALSKLIKK